MSHHLNFHKDSFDLSFGFLEFLVSVVAIMLISSKVKSHFAGSVLIVFVWGGSIVVPCDWHTLLATSVPSTSSPVH